MLTEDSRLNPVNFREGEKIKVKTKKKNNKNGERMNEQNITHRKCMKGIFNELQHKKIKEGTV